MTVGWMICCAAAIGVNGYIGWHYWHDACRKHKYAGAALTAVHLLLAACAAVYLFFYFTAAPRSVFTTVFSYIAAVYLGLLIYMALFYLMCDLMRFLLRKRLNRKAKGTLRRIYCGGLAVFLLAAAITLGGIYGARQLRVSRYTITLPRLHTEVQTLRAALVSDLHLGLVRSLKDLEEIKQQIEKQKPEAVFLCGDIFDESTSPQDAEEAARIIGGIDTRYGVFYIPGNHEYTSGRAARQMQALSDAGVTVLCDRTIRVADAFFLAGRIDGKGPRAPLDEVLGETPAGDLPVILLDHRPLYGESARDERVSLQLSGHTHNGQIFPYTPLELLGRLSYGLFRQEGRLQVAVTSGVGMFGVPLRIGSFNEIVELVIRFQ